MDKHDRVSSENYTEYLLCIDEVVKGAIVTVGGAAVGLVSELVIKMPQVVEIGGWAVAGAAGLYTALEGFNAWAQRD